MNYIIGEIINDYIIEQGFNYSQYARQLKFTRTEFTNLRNGHTLASPKKLSRIIDIELLRASVIEELKNNIDELNTDDLISLYNSVYARLKRKNKGVDALCD